MHQRCGSLPPSCIYNCSSLVLSPLACRLIMHVERCHGEEKLCIDLLNVLQQMLDRTMTEFKEDMVSAV